MKSIIMAGGSGSRLWPFSRKNYPKQFLKILGEESFIQITAKRLSSISHPQEIYVVAGDDYNLTIKDHLSHALGYEYQNMISEPLGRNTAPAIALTVKYLIEKKGADRDDILFFGPSDHIIEPLEDFQKAIEDAKDYAKENIVTFGINPSRPETGYGYIELNETGKNIVKVNRFVEKPDLQTAEQYLETGRFVWNSGMFMFSIGVILDAFEKYSADLFQFIRESDFDEALKHYEELESVSIDYCVMEKADNIYCSRMDVKWNDIGSWDSIYEYMEKDENGNVIIGDVEAYHTKNSLIVSKNNLTSLIDVKDLAVIETEDAVLISHRNSSQDVKKVVQKLREKKRREAEESITVYRPWGHYTTLEESGRYKIKKITVNEGMSLSLQRHHHRSEHWIVVKGTARVQINDQENYIHENESAYVPKSVVHRLSNPGIIPLEVIEVQNGEYVGEDDIERLEDIYGRIK